MQWLCNNFSNGLYVCITNFIGLGYMWVYWNATFRSLKSIWNQLKIIFYKNWLKLSIFYVLFTRLMSVTHSMYSRLYHEHNFFHSASCPLDFIMPYIHKNKLTPFIPLQLHSPSTSDQKKLCLFTGLAPLAPLAANVGTTCRNYHSMHHHWFIIDSWSQWFKRA